MLRAGGAEPTGECVALSGGLDSSVLLAALARVRARPLRAIHVDHGLHPDAALWSAHSVALAARCGVACEVVRVNATAVRGESPEAAARVARYAALAERLSPGEALLTAHHGDDQLETVLLQWLRGGGLRAVAGMRPVAPFADGWRVRPLLGFTRIAVEDWARGQGLEWLEDPSNADPRFDRNFLRREVVAGAAIALAGRGTHRRASGRAGGGGPRPRGDPCRRRPGRPHGRRHVAPRASRTPAAIEAAAGAARLATRARYCPAAGRDPGVIAARHARGRAGAHSRDALARGRGASLPGTAACRAGIDACAALAGRVLVAGNRFQSRRARTARPAADDG